MDLEKPNEPLVTIIVPCYNYGHLLGETLDSIKKQTYKNWECIIVDDGSTDSSSIVSNNYCIKDNRFKYIYQDNRGLSAARNTELKHAKGKYIQLLDADDLISPNKIEMQCQIVEENLTDISITTSEYFYHENYQDRFINNFGLDLIEEKVIIGFDLFKYFLADNRIPVSSPLIRREIIETIGDFDTQLKSLEDWDYWFRILLKNYKFSLDFTSTPQTSIRISHNSMSRNKTTMTLSRIVVYNKLLATNHSLIKRDFKTIRFYIKDNIKQYLYEVDYTTNYIELFSNLEKQVSTPIQYKLYKMIFKLRLISHKRLLWFIFDLSLKNLINHFKKK